MVLIFLVFMAFFILILGAALAHNMDEAILGPDHPDDESEDADTAGYIKHDTCEYCGPFTQDGTCINCGLYGGK